MITCIRFEFEPSELKKVNSNKETIFEQIDFDDVFITNQFTTLEEALDKDNPSNFDHQYTLNNIKQWGCNYRIGSSTIWLMVDLESDNLCIKTKMIIKSFVRDSVIEGLLELS